MNLPLLAAKNVMRARGRAILTIIAVAIAILAFVTLRTFLWSFEASSQNLAADRLATWNKLSFVVDLPKTYVDNVRDAQIPGVKAVTWANWFGGMDPKDETNFFPNFAVDSKGWFDVYSDMIVPAEQVEAWRADPQGAIVGDAIAKKMGWKIGDKATLAGTIYPGDWTFNVRGIYTATAKTVDRTQFLFHWDFLNNSLPAERRERVGWLISSTTSASGSGDIAKRIDALFDTKDSATQTMSERQMSLQFMAGFEAVLTAMNVVSFVILGILLLILGNTIAMGVRERTQEYGVLRAIGFRPKHLVAFVLGEALMTGLLGGGLGLLLSYVLIQKGMARAIEENMGSMLPTFGIPATTVVAAIVVAAGLGAIAAAIPAYQASRIKVTDALRRVG